MGGLNSGRQPGSQARSMDITAQTLDLLAMTEHQVEVVQNIRRRTIFAYQNAGDANTTRQMLKQVFVLMEDFFSSNEDSKRLLDIMLSELRFLNSMLEGGDTPPGVLRMVA